VFVEKEFFRYFYTPQKILAKLKCLFQNNHPRHDLQLVLSPTAKCSVIQNLVEGLNNSFSKIVLLRETKNPRNQTLINLLWEANNNPCNGTNDTTAKNSPFIEM